MYYLQYSRFTGTFENFENWPLVTTYWKFERKQDRDNAVLCIHTAYPTNKKNIPKDVPVKTFSHFRRVGYSELILKMCEKD